MDYLLIALVAYGNAHLAGRADAFPLHGVTSHGATIDFVMVEGDGAETQERIVASTAEDWFALLAQRGATSFALAWQPYADAWKWASTLNAGTLAITVQLAGGSSERWVPLTRSKEPPAISASASRPARIWQRLVALSDRTDERNRSVGRWIADQILLFVLLPVNVVRVILGIVHIVMPSSAPAAVFTVGWRHTLRMLGRMRVEPDAQPDIATAAGALRQSLERIRAFAAKAGADDSWTAKFTAALGILNDASPAHATVRIPQGQLPASAMSLLSACSAAWVFGGMGSWNEGPFPLPADQAELDSAVQEFERVSAELFESIMRGVIAAANTSAART